MKSLQSFEMAFSRGQLNPYKVPGPEIGDGVTQYMRRGVAMDSMTIGQETKKLGAAVGLGWLLLLPGAVLAEHDGITAKPPVEAEIAAYQPAEKLSDRILTIAGSDTMQPLLAKLANEFIKRQPDVRIVVEDVGSDEAIREFTVGYSLQRRGEKARKGHDGATELNLLASSRELTEQEIKAFTATNGYAPLAMPIARDAVTIYVHRDNPIQGLTLAQIDAIFGADRKRGFSEEVRTWGRLGLQETWRTQPIHLYGRNKDSGTRSFFRTVALLDGELREEVREQPGSASEVLAIARDPLGIGYAGVGFQTSQVRVVPVAKEAGMAFVTPSTASVMDGSYPLRRRLRLYVDKAPNGKLDPVIAEFLRFIHSREGQRAIVQSGFYPLTKQEVSDNLVALTGGSVAVSMRGDSGH